MSPRDRDRSARLAVLVLFALVGCGDVHVRRAHLLNGLREVRDRVEVRQGWDEGSSAHLDRHSLLESAWEDPAQTAAVLEARLRERPEPGGAMVLSGLHYRAGLRHERKYPNEAAAHYRDAAVLAALALTEPSPMSREAAITLHNRATTRLIDLCQSKTLSKDRSWHMVLAELGVRVDATPAAAYMRPERFETVTPTEQLKVIRMQHVYQSWGLGVPVVGIRHTDPYSTDPQERYFPREFHAGATTIMAPGGGIEGNAFRLVPARLVFHDQVEDPSRTAFGGRVIPLATDKTTPLVSQVDSSALAGLELIGLLRSDFFREGEEVTGGLYMRQAYRPGKIPVVLVHGLFSSPRAWIQTLNELANDPLLSRYYQFWVFMYPTGKPIPSNAAQLREALFQARRTFDPAGNDPAFDRMVVVGHSMGGVLAKMMIQESGRTLWDATVQIPFEELKAPPTVREEMRRMLIFQPVPFVNRVICIAAPHRGSPVADELIGKTVSSLIRGTDEQTQTLELLETLNGRDVITPELRSRRSLNSVNNLSQRSPVLRALDRLPTAPGIPYHTVAFFLGGAVPYDLLVPYRSAHLDGAASEVVLPGTHFSQQSLEASNEVRRILVEHLEKVPGALPPAPTAPAPAPPPPPPLPPSEPLVRR